MARVGKHHETPKGYTRRGVVLGAGGAGTALALPSLVGAAEASATTVGLRDKIYAIDAATTGTLSVAVYDRRSGRFWQYSAGVRNECASIVKVLVLATVCDRAQRLGRDLTAWEKSQASIMIRYSDNNAATNLWKSVGGAPAVQAMATKLRMYQTVTNKAWGLTTTSAYDQMVLMDEIFWFGRVLNSTNRGYISTLMGQVTSGQRWGVGTYGTSQVKNGWLPYNGQWRINSVGHVGGYGRNHTLAILQRTPTMAIGTSVANRVAKTMWDHLATPL